MLSLFFLDHFVIRRIPFNPDKFGTEVAKRLKL